jgi:hypothetical protein
MQLCYRPMAAHWILPANRVTHGLPTADSQRLIWLVVGPIQRRPPARRRDPLKRDGQAAEYPHVRNDLRISSRGLAV